MKKFKDTGLCVPEYNYMVDISSKLNEIKKLVDEREYFTINRPRQYGKTTTIDLIERLLKESGYDVISISFEGIGDSIFENEEKFSKGFIWILVNYFERINEINLENNKDLYKFVETLILGTKKRSFNLAVPIINLANVYGIIRRGKNDIAVINNKIYEEYITNYILDKLDLDISEKMDPVQSTYIKEDGKLDIDKYS